jgi:hypothetical protein
MNDKNSKRKKGNAMKAKIRKGNLVITVPLQEPTLWRSGSLLVADSDGVRKMAAKIDGKNVHVLAAAWIRPDEAQKGKRRAGRKP